MVPIVPPAFHQPLPAGLLAHNVTTYHTLDVDDDDDDDDDNNTGTA